MFASPAPAAEVEEIIYERADGVGDFGAVIFVTVLARHEGCERETRESHVFLPGRNLHLHEIVFATPGRTDWSESLGEAVRATHGLLAERVERSPLGEDRAGGGAEAGLRYATRRMDVHPFHDFRVRGWFSDAMWEIQDWTVSPALREALGRVTRCRGDEAEAELIKRIFSGA